MKNWFRQNYPFLVVIAAPIILFIGPLVQGRVIFWGTPVMQFLPWQTEAFEQIKQGIIPLWNPLNGMGAPLLANYQSALFYPINWIMFGFYYLGGIRTLAVGQTISIIFHLAWAGAGMVLLARKLGLGKPAQTISGICFALCGFLIPRVSFFPMIWAISWLPWIIYASTFIFTPKGSNKPIDLKGSLGMLFLLVLFLTLLLLAGHAQMAWYILLLTSAWVIATGWKNHGFRAALSGLGILAACVVFAAMIASIQLLPTFEYLMESQRAGAVNYGFAVTYSFWPWHFLTLLAPGMFGSPAVGNYWGYGNYWEDAIYFGVMPFFLALGTLTTFFKKKVNDANPFRFLDFFFWITVLVTIPLALGKYFYLFPFLYKFIPTFSLFQAPTRYMILAEFCLCLLAGIQVEKLTPPEKRRLYWTRLGTMGAFAVALGAILALILIPTIKSTLIRGFAWFGIFALGTGLLVLFKPKTEKGMSTWNGMLILFIAVDLLAAHWNFNPTISATFFPSHFPASQTSYSSPRTYLSLTNEYTIKYKWLFKFDSFLPEVDWQTIHYVNLANANIFDQVPVVNNYDPFVPARFSIWMTYLDSIEPSNLPAALQLMNVGKQIIPGNTIADHYSVDPINGGQAYRMFYCGVNASDSAKALTLTQNEITSGSIANTLVLETNEKTPDTNCDQTGLWEVTSNFEKPNHIKLAVSTSNEGYLFIPVTWYPGWEATVDGEAVKIIRSDFNFSSIKIPSGEHQVEIAYDPLSFELGVGISLLSLAALVILFAVYKLVIKKKPKID